MSRWGERPGEERRLLNPAFCGSLLWHSAQAYEAERDDLVSFEELFLVLPLVLHRETRESLPRTIRTSLGVWLEENPRLRSRIPGRSNLLLSFTKEALIFSGSHGLLQFEGGRVRAEMTMKRAVGKALRSSSEESRLCAKRAGFVGKWFAKSGNAATVLALMGVRP